MAKLAHFLGSDAFRDAHRVRVTDFTRKRSLPLPTLVAFLLQQCGGVALQSALDGFFGALRGQLDISRFVTKSAFCQARMKLKASAFAALNDVWVKGVHEAVAFERWCGHRVVAADGTCVRVPNWGENVDAFGVGPNKDGSVVMARCVAFLGIACRQVLSFTVGRYDEGEREILLRGLDALDVGDLLVLDRGYHAWWMFAALSAKGIAFCARIEGCGWPLVQSLLKSSQTESVHVHALDSQARKKLREMGIVDATTLAIRFVKVTLPNGKLEILATSLLDCQRYDACAFGPLYRSRWGIEESFKSIKHRLHLEGFIGELPQAIEQEMQAKALMYNITQALCGEASERLGATQRAKWQVNHAYALKQLGPIMICWLRGELKELARLIESVVNTLTRTLELIRPNRSFPRRHAIGGAQRPRRAYR